MDKQFWEEKWEKNIIHFHQKELNPLLKKYLPQLNLKDHKKTLVPLAGKTLDLNWLLENNYPVAAVEICEKAIKDYSRENKKELTLTRLDRFNIYQDKKLNFICGDFFEVTKELLNSVLGKVDLIYDRASLIALPLELRKEYYKKIIQLSHQNTKWLLISIEYDQGLLKGPPFSVTQEEIISQTQGFFKLTLLEESETKPLSGKFEKAGIKMLKEKIYLLEK